MTVGVHLAPGSVWLHTTVSRRIPEVLQSSRSHRPQLSDSLMIPPVVLLDSASLIPQTDFYAASVYWAMSTDPQVENVQVCLPSVCLHSTWEDQWIIIETKDTIRGSGSRWKGKSHSCSSRIRGWTGNGHSTTNNFKVLLKQFHISGKDHNSTWWYYSSPSHALLSVQRSRSTHSHVWGFLGDTLPLALFPLFFPALVGSGHTE